MKTLNYTALERVTIGKPVNRIKYLSEFCREKTVLDIGALDETVFTSKIRRSEWLHSECAKTARQVVGIDNSDFLRENGELKTSENSRIIYKDIYDVISSERVDGIDLRDFDVFLAGEIIEHLPDTMKFLEIFTSPTISRQGERYLLLSTPNATSCYNAALALFKMESCHRDHINVFSYKTLTTLMRKSNFENFEIIGTYTKFYEMKSDSRGLKKAFVVIFEKYCNIIEYFFPLKSAGFIVKIKLS